MATETLHDSRQMATMIQTSDTKIAAAMLAAGCELIDKDVSKSIKGYANASGKVVFHILIKDTPKAREIAKAWLHEKEFIETNPEDPQAYLMAAFYHFRNLVTAIKSSSVGFHTVVRKGKDTHFIAGGRPR